MKIYFFFPRNLSLALHDGHMHPPFLPHSLLKLHNWYVYSTDKTTLQHITRFKIKLDILYSYSALCRSIICRFFMSVEVTREQMQRHNSSLSRNHRGTSLYTPEN